MVALLPPHKQEEIFTHGPTSECNFVCRPKTPSAEFARPPSANHQRLLVSADGACARLGDTGLSRVGVVPMIAGLKDRFIPKVESGLKRHTIRRGKRWRAGMRIDLYRNVRQKSMELIFRAPVTKVESIQIVIDLERQRLWAWVNGAKLSDSELETLARVDGFEHGMAQMFVFWRDQHSGRTKGARRSSRPIVPGNIHFDGQIIHWDYERRTVDDAPARPRLRIGPPNSGGGRNRPRGHRKVGCGSLR